MNPTWLEYTFKSSEFPRYFQRTNRTRAELIESVRANNPPHVARFGDGEILCCLGWLERNNCDGHDYSPALAEALAGAVRTFVQTPNLWLGNWGWWPLAVWVHGLCDQWGGQTDWCDHGLFMHFKDQDNSAVRDLYLAIRDCPRRKVLVGPDLLQPAMHFLQASQFVQVPPNNGWDQFPRVRDELLGIVRPSDLVLLVYGMPAKPLMAEVIRHEPLARCFDIGTGLDPLVGRQTRPHQPDSAVMGELYGDVLNGILQS